VSAARLDDMAEYLKNEYGQMGKSDPQMDANVKENVRAALTNHDYLGAVNIIAAAYPNDFYLHLGQI